MSNSKNIISVDELHSTISRCADGCDNGFEQVAEVVKDDVDKEYGEDCYLIVAWSQDDKITLHDEITEMFSEEISDEESDWNYFDLTSIDDLLADYEVMEAENDGTNDGTNDPRKIISVDELHSTASRCADGCDKGFGQVVDVVKDDLDSEYGENGYVIADWDSEDKKRLFDELIYMFSEVMLDEDSDWNYFKLASIDDLSFCLPTLDEVYIPTVKPLVKAQQVVKVKKPKHWDNDDGESQKEKEKRLISEFNQKLHYEVNKMVDIASDSDNHFALRWGHDF